MVCVNMYPLSRTSITQKVEKEDPDVIMTYDNCNTYPNNFRILLRVYKTYEYRSFSRSQSNNILKYKIFGIRHLNGYKKIYDILKFCVSEVGCLERMKYSKRYS